jgi:serine protease inhibitor
MTQTRYFGHFSTSLVDVVEMAYEDVPLSMFIILPKKRDGLQEVEKTLKAEDLIMIFNSTDGKEVDLAIPTFTINSSVDLKGALIKLGVQQMFSRVGADFTRMADLNTNGAERIYISKALHKALIFVSFFQIFSCH